MVCAASDVEVRIYPTDYLKLLEGGNYIHFVATVISDDDESAAIDTYNLRLRVSDGYHQSPS